MIKIRNKAGQQIRTSKNLRGVLDYARISPVQAVLIYPAGAGDYLAEFRFDDGSYCATIWADWRVCVDWLKARRSWHWGDWQTLNAPNSGPRLSGMAEAVKRFYVRDFLGKDLSDEH